MRNYTFSAIEILYEHGSGMVEYGGKMVRRINDEPLTEFFLSLLAFLPTIVFTKAGRRLFFSLYFIFYLILFGIKVVFGR